MIASERVEPLGEPARHLGRSHIGRDDDEVLQLLLAEVRREHRRRVEVVDRNVEEPLQLVLVEVDPEHPIGSRLRDHVRHELGADGDARLVLAVLPRVPVVRHHAR